MSKKTVKVSVLVPIYNVACYLDECLSSLARQTLSDIEIICINDGSTDNSLEICKKYAKADKRFVIINKKNSGYGDSMNQGLKKACGEYISIVESDDFVKPEMLKTLYDEAVKNDADVVKTNAYFYWTDTNKAVLMELIDENNVGKVICPRTKKSNIYYKIPSIWSAIYRRDYLSKNDIHFLPTPGASYQDTSFTFKVWMSAERVVFLDKAFLYYRQDNAGSSMNNISKKASAIWKEFDEIEKYAIEHNYEEEMPIIKERKFIHSYNFLLCMQGKDILNFGKEISKAIHGYKVPVEYFQTDKQRKNFKMIQRHPRLFYFLKRNHMKVDCYKGYVLNRFMPSRRRENYIRYLKDELRDRRLYKGPEHYYFFEPETEKLKISIIVPTHNDKEIIKTCIDSLKAQTHSNIEIIIVNDGKDKESDEIIEKIAVSDPRIKTVKTHEKGVATARNAGLKLATGKFVMWCDSDDSFTKDTCEKMLKELLKSDSDFATCETNLFYAKDLKANLKQGVDAYLALKFVGKQALNPSIITRTDASLWNKIYRKDIIDDNNITFPDGLLFEDAYFNDLYMINSRSGDYMRHTALYNYVRKNDSIMSRTFSKTGFSTDYRRVAFKLYDYLKKNHLYEKQHELFWLRFIQYCFFSVEHLDSSERKEERKVIKEFVKKHKDEIAQESKYIRDQIGNLTRTNIFVKEMLKIRWIIKDKPIEFLEKKHRLEQDKEIQQLEKKIQKEF